MSDYSELKKLAEAAPEGPWFGPEYSPGTSYVFDVDLGTLLAYEGIDSEKDACLRYVAAANPADILALIADNERLCESDQESTELCDTLSVLLGETAVAVRGQEEPKSRHGFHDIPTRVKTVVAERDQLKAEVEALRKNSDRYQFLKNLPDDQYLIERLECATDPEDWDAAIDRAIGKEAGQ